MRVLTVGTFDLGHYGHVYLFSWCRRVAGVRGEVIVSVNKDDFVERFKGKKPVLSYKERVSLIKAFKDVDRVIPNEVGEDSKPTIVKINPDVIIIGSDWLKRDYLKQMGFTPEWLEEKQIALMYIPRHLSISTSEIKKRIL